MIFVAGFATPNMRGVSLLSWFCLLLSLTLCVVVAVWIGECSVNIMFCGWVTGGLPGKLISFHSLSLWGRGVPRVDYRISCWYQFEQFMLWRATSFVGSVVVIDSLCTWEQFEELWNYSIIMIVTIKENNERDYNDKMCWLNSFLIYFRWVICSC